MLSGSGRGIAGTVTRPAPSRPRLDWLVLLRVLRTDTEVPCEALREARERPDMEREEGREVLLDTLRELPESGLPEPEPEPEPLPEPERAAGTAWPVAAASGARPHSVQ